MLLLDDVCQSWLVGNREVREHWGSFERRHPHHIFDSFRGRKIVLSVRKQANEISTPSVSCACNMAAPSPLEGTQQTIPRFVCHFVHRSVGRNIKHCKYKGNKWRLNLSSSEKWCRIDLKLVNKRLTRNDPYMGRTAWLTSILYIYSTNVGTEYFKHALYSPFLSLQNAVCFIMLTCLVSVLFTFYIQALLKLKK